MFSLVSAAGLLTRQQNLAQLRPLLCHFIPPHPDLVPEDEGSVTFALRMGSAGMLMLRNRLAVVWRRVQRFVLSSLCVRPHPYSNDVGSKQAVVSGSFIQADLQIVRTLRPHALGTVS